MNPGLVSGARGLLYTRKANVPKGDSQWCRTAEVTLARGPWWGGDHVLLGRESSNVLGRPPQRVQVYKHAPERGAAVRYDVSILGTVRWNILQMGWGQPNCTTGEKKNCALRLPNCCTLPENASRVVVNNPFTHNSAHPTRHIITHTCLHTQAKKRITR